MVVGKLVLAHHFYSTLSSTGLLSSDLRSKVRDCQPIHEVASPPGALGINAHQYR